MRSEHRAAAVVLLTTMLLSGCYSAESSTSLAPVVRPVKLLTIQNTGSEQSRIFPAKIAAHQQADLAFRINGQLVSLSLIEGQRVKKGQLLAQLDARDAKNTLLNAESNYELADLDYKRKRELLKKKLISKSEFDIASASFKASKASLQSAKDNLQYTRIEAPFSGVIAQVSLDNHQMIQAGQTVLTLQSEKQLDVTIQMPESMLIDMNDNQWQSSNQPKVRFSGSAATYPVTYKEHASKISPGTQAYQVTFTLSQPAELNVLPGMSAELLLNSSESSNVIAVIPIAAVVNDDDSGETLVWSYDTELEKLERRLVTLGRVKSNGVEILSGLKHGDKIVIAGSSQLTENSEVKPLRWQRGV
ncbi:efflux RND transporter periplasmic adaptor subunit [Photobacterium sp. OFAV2-7]|uniref:efflux RND transporter periplasmic adaptor subunit n=1 Tax=Photobacterium sp. OFAV2-7 TaxID=2917748 RepID=UPI001EF465BE|nr:efflux RND transporter periplasmic adaptor subunit [Photobacterium sp. OFAV2-7]MCG7588643.1 efflux RND transporter periplasmic adaptor subunit [Photobacterium sp. OFAV2-7]